MYVYTYIHTYIHAHTHTLTHTHTHTPLISKSEEELEEVHGDVNPLRGRLPDEESSGLNVHH